MRALSEPDHVREEIDELFPQTSWVRGRSIAVLLPCYNEATSIADVVTFRRVLPSAQIYVTTTTGPMTSAAAEKAGAIVRTEPYQGKGNVVRRMLADVDANVYVIADGNATYNPDAAGQLIDVQSSATSTWSSAPERLPKALSDAGTRSATAFSTSPSKICLVQDLPIFCRAIACSRDASPSRFRLLRPVSKSESIVGVRPRPQDGDRGNSATVRSANRRSHSKLRVFAMVCVSSARSSCSTKSLSHFVLWRDWGQLTIAAFGLVLPLALTYLETGLVPRLPTAILATGMVQLGVLSFAIGLVLEAVARSRREAKRMRYLDLRSVAEKTNENS